MRYMCFDVFIISDTLKYNKFINSTIAFILNFYYDKIIIF